MRFNLYGRSDIDFCTTCWMANDYKLLNMIPIQKYFH